VRRLALRVRALGAPRDGAYARREALKDLPLRCAQDFFGVRFQSSLRPHPAPPAYLLLGMGPTLAGNVGTGSAFALTREGDQGVDVPTLAPAPSRSASAECRWVDFPNPFPPKFQPQFSGKVPRQGRRPRPSECGEEFSAGTRRIGVRVPSAVLAPRSNAVAAEKARRTQTA
jgi:hypothetical protein